MNKEKMREEIRKRANELLESIKEELFLCQISADVDRLGRLVTLVHYHTSYELMKSFRDKGLNKEITELADKAGKIGAKKGELDEKKEEV